jgi:hypothetical protein
LDEYVKNMNEKELPGQAYLLKLQTLIAENAASE